MAGWFGGAIVPTKNNEPKKDRDEELENLLGNLLVAKYQVMRLEDKLSTRVDNGYENSTFMFKHENTWYKVLVNVEKQIDEKPDDEEAKLDQALETVGP